jgi:tetratricopeptide (TPR) repeat protein
MADVNLEHVDLDADEVEPSTVAPHASTAVSEVNAEPKAREEIAPPSSSSGLPEETEAELARAEKLSHGNDGERHTALEIYRKFGETYPSSARVLRGWSQAASRAKWWGESLRVAIRWAAMDPSIEAQLNLAKTQRLVGQRYGAIQTLERLLEQEPSNEAAQAMLRKYRQD